MTPILYSHRLKSVLQHTVIDLGLVLVLNDLRTGLDLASHEAMLRETAERQGLAIDIVTDGNGTTVTIYQPG